MQARIEPERSEVSLRRRAATIASLLGLIGLLVGALFGDRGILQLQTQRERAEALAAEIEELRADNRRLAAEIEGLKGDPRAIEQLAREQLGLVRPGETVFLIRDEGER
jgi:cell division protein FtsB